MIGISNSLEQNTELLKLYPLAKIIRSKYKECELWLFGSRARGDFHTDSDYDLLVIHDYPDNVTEQIKDIVWEYGFDLDLFLCPLILSKKDTNFKKYTITPIYRNIMKEGIQF